MKHKQPLRRLLPLVLALAAAFALTISASAATGNWTNHYAASEGTIFFTGTADCDTQNDDYESDGLSLTGALSHFSENPHYFTINEIKITNHSANLTGASKLDTTGARLKDALITVSDGIVEVNGHGNDLTVNGGTVYAYGSFDSITVTDGALYLGSNSSGADVNTLSFNSLSVSGGSAYAAGTLSGSITASGSGALFVGYRYNGSSSYAVAGQQTTVTGTISLGGSAALTVRVDPASTNNTVTVTGTFNGDNQPNLTVNQGYVNASGHFGAVAVNGGSSTLYLNPGDASAGHPDVNKGMSVTNSGTVEVTGSEEYPVTITNDNTAPTIISISGTDSSVTLNEYVTVTGTCDSTSMTGVTLDGGTLTMEDGSKIELTATGNSATTMTGVSNSGAGTVSIKQGAGVYVTNNTTSTNELTMTGVKCSGNGSLTAAHGTIELTNGVSGKAYYMYGVNLSGGNGSTVHESGTITLTNSGIVYSGMYGVNASSDSGKVNVTGNVTLDNESTVSNNMYGVYNNGSGEVNVIGNVTLDNEGTVSTMYGVYNNGSGTVNVTGNVTLDKEGTVSGAMYGVYNRGTTVNVTGKVELTNIAGDSVSNMCGVYGENGAVNVKAGATVKLTNNSTVSTGSMYGVYASGTGTVNVTGSSATVTLTNNGTVTEAMYGVDNNGATVKVTEATIQVTGKDGGNDTMRGVHNYSGSSVYLKDATVTLTKANGLSCGVFNEGALAILATKELNASTYAADSAVAPTAPSVKVTTDNGTALILADNSYAAIRGAYGAALFKTTGSGCKALSVGSNVQSAVEGQPVITCGRFVDGTGDGSTGNVLADDDNITALLNGGVNYYVSDDSTDTAGVYTVTDAVWAIQYYMGEGNNDDSGVTNSAYATDASATFTLPCNVNFETGYNYGMPGALANSAANKTVAVADERTLDLNGYSITGSTDNDIFTDGTTGKALTVVNGGAAAAITATAPMNAIALSYGDAVVKADAGDITITGNGSAYQFGVTTYQGSVGVYTKDNAVVTVNGDVGAGAAGSVTVGTYTIGDAAVIVKGNVLSVNGNLLLTNHGDGTDPDADPAQPYTGAITVYGYVASLGSGSVVIENGDNSDDAFESAIYVLGKNDADDAGVYSKGGSVEVYNVSTYSKSSDTVAVKIVNAVQSGADDVGIWNTKTSNTTVAGYSFPTPVGSVGNVSVGNVVSGGDVWVGVYSNDAATTVTLGSITSDADVGVYNSGNAAIVVSSNVYATDGDVTIANIGLGDGCEYASEITVLGYVGANGNVIIENGADNTDTFHSAIYIVGEGDESWNAGKSVISSDVVAVSNVGVYTKVPDVVAVKIANEISGEGGVAVVNGYVVNGYVVTPHEATGSVSVGDVTGGMVYVNAYTANDSVTVDLGAIKSGEGNDVIIYSEGKSMLTVYGDVNDGADDDNGDVGVYATDEAAVAILGTVNVTEADLTIENASAYDTGDPATSYAIKIAPTGDDGVSFYGSGTLTIANKNTDTGNGENGKILIVGDGDYSDGVYISDADAKLKVSNEEGAVIEFKANGSSGSYGLRIGSNVPKINIDITGSTATYSSVKTAQTVGVYKGILGDAYDWKVGSTALPRTAENYFDTPATNRTVRTTLGDNSPSSVYSVGAAVSYTLKVDPSSQNVSTTDPVTPTVSLMSGTTNLGNAAITAVAFDPAASATEDGHGQNPAITKAAADSSKVTVTYTDAYGKTANYVMNPSNAYVPSGGGGSAPAAITVPVSGESKSVAVSATVNGSVATMRTPSEQQLQSVIGASVHTGEVTIDMSGLGSSITTAAIPTETFKAISQAVSATNNDATALTIKVANGSVTFDATALSAISNEATATTVSLNVSKTNVSSLNAAQRAAVQAISSQAVYSITVTSGSKTIATFANGSATISVPYTLTSGQSAAGLVVWYVADDGTMTEIPCTFAGGRVVFTVTHFSNYVIAYDASRVQAQTGCPKDSSCPISAFSDASANAWYHDGVHWALENVIMSGWTTADGAKVFDPNGTTSRAMVAQILWNLEGRPAATGTAKFNDVADSAWYASAINWAASANIVNGYDDPSGSGRIFKPDDAVTREQLAAMLYRYAQSKGQGFQGAWAFPLNYPDAASVADWAYEAMCWMTMHGIINGVDGQLAPSANASRAVVATMLQRYTDVAK